MKEKEGLLNRYGQENALIHPLNLVKTILNSATNRKLIAIIDRGILRCPRHCVLEGVAIHSAVLGLDFPEPFCPFELIEKDKDRTKGREKCIFHWST